MSGEYSSRCSCPLEGHRPDCEERRGRVVGEPTHYEILYDRTMRCEDGTGYFVNVTVQVENNRAEVYLEGNLPRGKFSPEEFESMHKVIKSADIELGKAMVIAGRRNGKRI
jgi:hypothetical protein